MATATKKAPKPVRLPKKPSALIRIALEDLAKAERSPKCEINMAAWHRPTDSGCAMCMAGAVMRSRLGVPDDQRVYPDEMRGNERQLEAIDLLRNGYVSTAFERLRIRWSASVPSDTRITPYENDRTAFKRDMRRLAADLEAAGY